MGSTFQLFERAERLELACAGIYRSLAEQFRYDPAARDLLGRLAAEEEQHAARVRLLAGRYQHDSRLLMEARVAAHHLDDLLAEAQQAQAQIDAGQWRQDFAAVKARLGEMEERFSASHAHVIASGANPALRAFFEQLARQDKAHGDLLRR